MSLLIEAELCDCSDVENLIIKKDRDTYVVLGDDFCKTYPQSKAFQLKLTNAKIVAEFNLKSHSCGKKVCQLMSSIYDNSTNCQHKLFWSKMNDGVGNVTNFDFSLKKVSAVKANHIRLGNDVYFNRETACVVNNGIIKRKVYGCVIFDGIGLLQSLKSIISKESFKTAIVTDEEYHLKKSKTNILIYDSAAVLESVRKNKEYFVCKRLILYYPTNKSIDDILSIIDMTSPPKNIFIIFNKNTLIKPHIASIISILTWCNDISVDNACDLVNIEYNVSTIKPQPSKNNVKILRHKYMLSQCEKLLVSDVDNSEQLEILDMITLKQNNSITSKLCADNNSICSICTNEYSNSNAAYMKCGHSVCTSCISITLTLCNTCPMCRKTINPKTTFVPSIRTPSKISTLVTILKSITVNTNILIYCNNSAEIDFIKGIMDNDTYINDNFNMIKLKKTYSAPKKTMKDTIFFATSNFKQMVSLIKGIENVIITMCKYEVIMSPEYMGYDYCIGKKKINLQILETSI